MKEADKKFLEFIGSLDEWTPAIVMALRSFTDKYVEPGVINEWANDHFLGEDFLDLSDNGVDCFVNVFDSCLEDNINDLVNGRMEPGCNVPKKFTDFLIKLVGDD